MEMALFGNRKILSHRNNSMKILSQYTGAEHHFVECIKRQPKECHVNSVDSF